VGRRRPGQRRLWAAWLGYTVAGSPETAGIGLRWPGDHHGLAGSKRENWGTRSEPHRRVGGGEAGDETARWWSRVLSGGGTSSSRRSLEWSGEGEHDVENLPRWLMEHGTHQSVGRGGRGKIGREVADRSSWKRGKRAKE
jgi:hypothetical protein